MMNRVVLITGASSGIGAATARLLGEDCRLVLVARRAEALEELAASIASSGGTAHPIAADLCDPASHARVVAEAVERFGGLDVLINNAGAYSLARCDEMTSEHAEGLWRLNVLAPMLLTRHALPYLQEDRGGWVVNISSVAATNSFHGCAAYAGTKAALDAWSRTLREELRQSGVRVGVVVPGATSTEVWPPDTTFDRERMCRATDVAAAIRFMITAPPTCSVDQIVVTPPGGAL